MQQMIDEQEQRFEMIADAMRGADAVCGETGDEIVKAKTHVRTGFTKNHGRGTSKARRRTAAASRRRNRAA